MHGRPLFVFLFLDDVLDGWASSLKLVAIFSYLVRPPPSRSPSLLPIETAGGGGPHGR